MTPNKHHDLIVAWAKGADIQWYDGSTWITTPYPGWGAEQSYRIKPEPKPDVILYGCVVKGSVFICNIDTLKIKTDNVKFIFDGETGKLKKAEVINEA